jgi:hypothetical protein
MKAPNGLAEIISTFGNISNYIDNTGVLSVQWNTEYLAIVELPFALPLSWNKAITVSRMTCHKLMVPIFEDVFNQINTKVLQDQLLDFGGCFSFRPERHSNKISTHAWGIAIDLNPNEDIQGTIGNMSPAIIDVFRSAGFKWGGDWVGKTDDPMHFQYAYNY